VGAEKLAYESKRPMKAMDRHCQTRSEGHRHNLGRRRRSRKNWRQTEQNGINVWSNAPRKMRDKLLVEL